MGVDWRINVFQLAWPRNADVSLCIASDFAEPDFCKNWRGIPAFDHPARSPAPGLFCWPTRVLKPCGHTVQDYRAQYVKPVRHSIKKMNRNDARSNLQTGEKHNQHGDLFIRQSPIQQHDIQALQIAAPATRSNRSYALFFTDPRLGALRRGNPHWLRLRSHGGRFFPRLLKRRSEKNRQPCCDLLEQNLVFDRCCWNSPGAG